jgi:small-conductance mechanosensitive channel
MPHLLSEREFSNFWPGLLLAIGFPVAMLILNEVIQVCRRREAIFERTARATRNLVIPSSALLVFVRFVLELPQVDARARVVETIFWLSFLYVVLGLFNDIIFGALGRGSWRERVPKLFTDLLRVVLVAVGAMVIYSNVWGREVAGALTALGVGSVVIGLALQEPLGNIVSGLMLLFERPLKVGDWISAEGVTGKVIEINWRSVHIQTPTRELRIVPNVRLYKGAFSNLSRPTDVRTESFEIGFSYDDAPNRVKSVLEELLLSTPGVLQDPPPGVRTTNYADWSVTYKVVFSVARQEELAATRDRIMTRLWYVARREGLTIPFPIQMEYSPGESPSATPRSPLSWLQTYPRFKSAVKEGATDQPVVVEYAQGEVIHDQSRKLSGFALILKGRVRLLSRDSSGGLVEVGEIGPGECFGDHLTTGASSDDTTVSAGEDVKIMLFDSRAFTDILNRSPELAAEIGEAIEARRQTARGAQQGYRRKAVG